MSFLFDVQMDNDESPVEWLIVKAICAGDTRPTTVAILSHRVLAASNHPA